MADVCIIHTAEDREPAGALASALAERGFEIARPTGAATSAPAVVALWSSAAVSSADLVRDATRAQGRGALISVGLGAEAPEGAGPIVIDLSAWPGGDSAASFERLVQAIAALRGRPAKAVTTRPSGAALMRGVLIGAAVAAVAVTAVIAVTPMLEPAKPAVLPGPPPDFAENAGEFTDSPGAADLYGMTLEEIDAASARGLIDLARERTAVETIEAEAARGDTLGKALLCAAQYFGAGLPRDPDAARVACAAADRADNGFGTFLLSLITREGQPGYATAPGDIEEADRLLARAAQLGDPRALTAVAVSERAAGEYVKALNTAQRAASRGHGPAQVLIGAMYEAGQGVPQDYGQALQWYARAEEAGSPEAVRAIGALYEAGTGVTRDYAQARRRYEQASQRGDGEATQRLASMVERGLGGPADVAQARRLYQRAIDQGYGEAQADLARIGPG